jgi:hypothetical protein
MIEGEAEFFATSRRVLSFIPTPGKSATRDANKTGKIPGTSFAYRFLRMITKIVSVPGSRYF